MPMVSGDAPMSPGRLSPTKTSFFTPLPIIGQQKATNRASRQKLLGVDCVDAVMFDQWQPGKDYVKTLVGTAFTVDFSKMTTLSTGTTWSIPVTFSPLKHERHHDTLEFSTPYGPFTVDLAGNLPQHKLVFTEKLDFGYSPVRATSMKSIQLSNLGPLPSYFVWNEGVNSPFTVLSPKNGTLAPGESVNVVVQFCPQDASVCESNLVCCFGDRDRWDEERVTRQLRATGVGKYSYVRFRHNVKKVEFGDALVPASFTVTPKEIGSSPSAFSVYPSQGVIGPRSSAKLKLIFAPNIVFPISAESFNIDIPSGTSLQLTCTGEAVASKVALSTTALSFGEVPSAYTVSKSVMLKNLSSERVAYQFTLDGTGVFKADKTLGTLEPRRSATITFTFSANEPFNYYRRIYCLLEHHDALTLDLLATCFTDQVKPICITAQHLDAFHRRISNGLWMYHPDELQEMLQLEVIQFTRNHLSYVVIPRDLDFGIHSDAPCEGSEMLSEFYNETLLGARLAGVSESSVNFGSSFAKGFVTQKTIRVSNNTKGQVAGLWSVPSSGFTIEPKTFDLKAQDIADFKVFFDPGQSRNELFTGELEAFMTFAGAKTVDERTLTPSWCLKVAVTGNSLTTDAPPGAIDVSQPTLQFPGSHVERSLYSTIKVFNPSAQPVKFAVEDIGSAAVTSSLGSVLSVRPRHCTLNSLEHRLIVARFVPADPLPYSHQLQCLVNDKPVENQVLQLGGTGHFAKVSLSTGTSLSFRPTLLGTTAVQQITIQNLSQISVDFKWLQPTDVCTFFSVEPAFGLLVPNGSQVLKCTFNPTAVRGYNVTLACQFGHHLSEQPPWPDHPQNFVNTLTLDVKGQGSIGKVVAEPKLIDFGPVLLGQAAEREVRIFNPTECDILFDLNVVRVGGGSDDAKFDVTTSSDMLYARAYSTIRIRVEPSKCVESKFRVLYQVRGFSKKNKPEAAKLLKLFDVNVQGVRPVTQVMDVRSSDMSKSALWRMFSIEQFNTGVETGLSDSQEEESDDSQVVFDFGAASFESVPTVVSMRMVNPGVVPVHWAFDLPNHMDVQPETWIEVADQTEEEAQQTFVVDHELFEISPRNGTLAPNEEIIVHFAYYHRERGSHHLPCIFRLSSNGNTSGQTLIVTVTGNTVDPVQKYAHLTSSTFHLRSVAVNSMRPPVQIFEIPNFGLVSWQYEISEAVFKQIREQNHGFEVLSCLQPKGCVNPGDSAWIPFIFRPAETKTYLIEIPIKIDDGATRMVTFQGRGIAQYTQSEDFKRVSRTEHGDKIPTTRSIEFENQLAVLSVDRVNFGHAPLGALLRQVAVIQSQPGQRLPLRFLWQIPPMSGLESLAVTPMTGILEPGQSVVCKMVMTLDQQPRILDIDLVCLLFHDQDRMSAEAISQTSIDRTSFIGNREFAMKGSRVDLRTIKYRPLPPINSSNVDPDSYDEPLSDERNRGLISTPVCKMYLGLAVHSHCAEEFKSLYTGFEECFFEPIQARPTNLTKAPSSSTKTVFTSMVDQMMDDIMQELDSEGLAESLVHEPDPPYFAQLTSVPSNGVYSGDSKELSEEEREGVEKVLRSTKFQTMAEKVFENTIFNLLLEADAGEFDVTVCR
ncbi:hypothetical protein SmJEL517_g05717 [Synchytrium microbalum]|uniref:Abnormal spindle-like microcephaly-associated protein ASH domain-containing protein n=1 Tax=Synchytrium microbalum TaxID=1806994 RepID=A0A507BMF3_9FUNG|nr:uncharacterized protein SmJEL517_g05717 [Synchytrium microbalum]TPX30807.1 hypothetical protein SmJEL517_g05717 [Synchytrium microbalum]